MIPHDDLPKWLIIFYILYDNGHNIYVSILIINVHRRLFHGDAHVTQQLITQHYCHHTIIFKDIYFLFFRKICFELNVLW